MILTLALNPSVDMNYRMDEFNIDDINRIGNVSKTAGGKGLNVARVIQQLGEAVGAGGFLGGHLGDFIREEISKQDIHDRFTDIKGQTRNCIALIHDGKQTEILEEGPVIDKEEERTFLDSLSNLMDDIDVMTVSGSLPKELDPDFYSRILEIAGRFNVKVLLDTNGKLLKQTLEDGTLPYMIKPNEKEFNDLHGREGMDEAEIIEVLKSNSFENIPLVVITTGDQGAYIKYETSVFKAHIPRIEAVNPVGSGDSVVAGFAVGLKRQMSGRDLIRYGLSMGVLNAMESKTGSVNIENIDWCMKQIVLDRL